MRIFWLILGLISLGLGILGIPAPFLPTVPFLLLAAFCFARSSQRLHEWLVTHPSFGPPIQDWNERGAIHPRFKLIATGSIAAAFLLSVFLKFGATVLVIQAIVLSCVLFFIWSRPNY